VGGIDYFSKPFDLRERELHLRESEELLKVGRPAS
jgi:hypothetical protein